MNYPIPMPEPEPLPNEPCVIQINLLDFFLLWIGAGIGYFMVGHCGGLWCLKSNRPPSASWTSVREPTETNQVILARTISNQN